MSLRKDKWYVRFRKKYTNNTRSRSAASLGLKGWAKDCVKPSDDQMYITINDEGRTHVNPMPDCSIDLLGE